MGDDTPLVASSVVKKGGGDFAAAADSTSSVDTADLNPGAFDACFATARVIARQRAAFAGVEALDEAQLLATLEDWLAPLLTGKRALSGISPGDLHNALQGLAGWDAMQAIERIRDDLKLPMLIVTHDRHEAERLGQHIIQM